MQFLAFQLKLVLKGGMAMRAVFDSLRLTKGIDFDRDPRFDCRRTTNEKALLDWIYLGASKRSRMTARRLIWNFRP